MSILVLEETLMHMRLMQGTVAGVAAVMPAMVAVSSHARMPLLLLSSAPCPQTATSSRAATHNICEQCWQR